MHSILILLSLPFLYLNYKIVSSDMREKKIPNRYLGYLLGILPLYYIYLFLSLPDILLFGSISQVTLSLIISFILYYFSIWSAGDAKYLLVLSLYIPHIGVVPFIGNIALLTVAYLIIYYIYFYFGKCFFQKGYAISLYGSITKSLHDSFMIFISDESDNIHRNTIIKKIASWFMAFSLVFVSIRMGRIYIFEYLLQSDQSYLYLIQEYSIYFLFAGVIIFIGILYRIKVAFLSLNDRYIIPFQHFISRKTSLGIQTLNMIFLSLALLILINIIGYEYMKDPSGTIHDLKLIFTYYLLLRITIKILIYSYKVAFHLSEQEYVLINSLRPGDLVDKLDIRKIFDQRYLEYLYSEGKLSEHPSDTFDHIENPLDAHSIHTIQKYTQIVNQYHAQEGTLGADAIEYTKILKTFAFGGYIFVGFLLSYFFGSQIISYITSAFIQMIQNIYK